jgi:hypothetical protein
MAHTKIPLYSNIGKAIEIKDFGDVTPYSWQICIDVSKERIASIFRNSWVTISVSIQRVTKQ